MELSKKFCRFAGMEILIQARRRADELNLAGYEREMYIMAYIEGHFHTLKEFLIDMDGYKEMIEKEIKKNG